jgi:FtsH-binding integral membrane protein
VILTVHIERELFNDFAAGVTPYPTAETAQEHLLEQYKLYLEMADRISGRRETANSFFLTVNTTLLGFVGYISTSAASAKAENASEYLWLLGVVGIALCYLWARIIRSYRDLNSAKFKMVHLIEKRLPLRLFHAEWEAMGRGENPAKYKPVTHVEKTVPWVFILLHAFVVLRALPIASLVTAFKGICTSL